MKMCCTKYLFEILVLATLPIFLAAQNHPDWDAKVDKDLQQDLISGKTVAVFCSFSSTVETLKEVYQDYNDVTDAGAYADQAYAYLRYFVTKEQLSIHNALRDLEFSDNYKVKFERLLIVNRLYIENCNLKIANLVLENGPKLTRMEKEKAIPDFRLFHQKNLPKYEGTDDLSWGLQKIEIEKAWESVGGKGMAGKGARVGIIDTGFDENVTLINGNYNKHYGYISPSDGRRSHPKDLSGHGTHITGTIVGKNGIGVAPGAEFIGCRGCDIDKGCPRIYIEMCADFLFCPYAYDITLKGCARIPDVIFIGFGTYETTATWFDDIIRAWTAVKIVAVVAAGNGGGKCNTVAYPGTSNDVLTVGASGEDDGASEFTAFGPIEGNKYVKPDFVAPGTNIKSASLPNGNEFTVNSGTAVAAAHVTGLVLIIRGLNKKSNLRAIRKKISKNTDFLHPRGDEKCDSKTDDDQPNYKYGNGRINAFKTVDDIK